MNIFDNLSSMYDRGMRPLEWLIFRRLRRLTFPKISGRVLELGVGTGINLPLYGSGARVTGCDASGEMLAWASRRRTQAPAALVQADAQRLPFAAASFDAVTGSLVFCSVADPEQGLMEARRVLRLGGQLVLLEHTRGSGIGAWLTDALHPLWYAWSRECHLNRETAQTVAQAGFEVRRVKQHALGIVRVIEGVSSQKVGATCHGCSPSASAVVEQTALENQPSTGSSRPVCCPNSKHRQYPPRIIEKILEGVLKT